jgi:hypothetical protein
MDLRLAEQLGCEPEPPLLWSLAFIPLTRGEWEPTREIGERLRARAERDDDQVLWVESDYIRGIAGPGAGRRGTRHGSRHGTVGGRDQAAARDRSAPRTVRLQPSCGTPSRWHGASRRARSRSGSGKRSRNAPSATVVLCKYPNRRGSDEHHQSSRSSSPWVLGPGARAAHPWRPGHHYRPGGFTLGGGYGWTSSK